MISGNCSIKLLKKAFIGYGVRMTSGPKTIPFDNKPMIEMVIKQYTKQGFQISHPHLPKAIWVDFDQLPLIDITLINGIIGDEITFVENMITHKMELIKTSNPEYQQLLEIEKEEVFEEFITLKDANPGEILISALCKEGIPMTYLGTWYTKKVARKKHNYGYGYHDYRNKYENKFYLSKNSPKYAFFAIESDQLTSEEEKLLDVIKEPEWKDYRDERPIDYDVACKNYRYDRKELKNIIKSKVIRRFKIISYPISSKKVKKFIKSNVIDESFKDLKYNELLILSLAGKYDGDYYGRKPEQNNIIELNEDYLKVIFNNFTISNSNWDLQYANFITSSKIDINKIAYKFINENYKCNIEASLQDIHGELENFEI